MPKLRIIDTPDQTAVNGTVLVNYVFWIDVQPGREVEAPGARSVVKEVPSEIAIALQKGAIIERPKQMSFAVDMDDPDSRKLALSVARKKLAIQLLAEQVAEDNKLDPYMFAGIEFNGEKWSDE